MTRRRLDQVLVIDLESSCWEKEPPKDQVSEIIEIGLCLYDIQQGSLSDPVSILVRPLRSKVSQYCTGLTGLTQADVDKGIPFADACVRLEQEFKSRQRVWASWWVSDRLAIERQCKRAAVRYPMNVSHVNLKTWFALCSKHKRESGQDRALRSLKLTFEGNRHRGDWDAYNAGRVLRWMLRGEAK